VREPINRDAILRWRTTDGAAWIAYRPLREPHLIAALGTAPEVLVRTPALILARVR